MVDVRVVVLSKQVEWLGGEVHVGIQRYRVDDEMEDKNMGMEDVAAAGGVSVEAGAGAGTGAGAGAGTGSGAGVGSPSDKKGKRGRGKGGKSVAPLSSYAAAAGAINLLVVC